MRPGQLTCRSQKATARSSQPSATVPLPQPEAVAQTLVHVQLGIGSGAPDRLDAAPHRLAGGDRVRRADAGSGRRLLVLRSWIADDHAGSHTALTPHDG